MKSGFFKEFVAFGREHKVELHDPKALEAFTSHIAEEVETAIASDARLHGHRTQNMFEALIVSLGRYKILKVEDAGIVHSKEPIRVPDFLVVLEDGRRWAVEVKNVFEKEPSHQETSFKSSYVDELRSYSEGIGYELKLAIYWARWATWTLISAETLRAAGDRLATNMFEALNVNEIGALGDATVGTVPPLRLRLYADPSKPRRLIDTETALITIATSEITCGRNIINNETDRSIAWLFMEYGEWKLSGPHPIMSGDLVDALEYVWNPIEMQNVGFEVIGSLSRMFAGYFASETLRGGKVVRIDAKAVPEWFRPLVDYGSHKDRQLPIWKFVLKPKSSGMSHGLT